MSKISYKYRRQASGYTLLVLLLAVLQSRAQLPDNINRPVIIKDVALFKQVALKDSGKAMVDIRKHVPGVVTSLRYATKKNFTHHALYPHITTTYLRKPAAAALALVQEALKLKGMSLKVFDAYRPYRVSQKMWDMIRDERYVANPLKGSGHNRGTAVDLTIIDIKNRREINMGTGFDNFTDTAHHSFGQLPADVLQHRILLRSLMEQHGFAALETEWWHYNFSDAITYELLDIPFAQLKKMAR